MGVGGWRGSEEEILSVSRAGDTVIFGSKLVYESNVLKE